MNETLVEIVVWIIIGMLAGSLTGLAVKRNKKGFGWYINLGIGMVGALIGGFLFNLFDIDLGSANIKIELQDIVAAFVGSLIFLLVLFYARKWYKKKSGKPQVNA
jgi:uncharacterized membrane protein YeaQ/YmgE (transglycosylase-associated protein family)